MLKVDGVSRVRIAYVCAAAAGIALFVLVPHRILEGTYLNHVSGVWATLADDFAHGILYRPLVSTLGYGGTRYFPVAFVFHGLLTRSGLSLVAAGHVLALLSGAGIVGGGALGLRRSGAAPALAWALALLALLSSGAFMGLAGIRGDILPVALGVLGMALSAYRSPRALAGAAVLLALAALTKPTLFWAASAACVALLVSGEKRKAIALGGAITLLVVAGIGASEWASHGQMLASFRACASGGGFSISNLLGEFLYVRQGELGWICGGLVLTILRGRRGLADPMSCAVVLCLASTLFLLTSKGTHVNLLVDASVVGALAVGVAFVDPPAARDWAPVALPIATCLGISEAVLFGGTLMKRGELEQAVNALPPGNDPILSEQPWIPLMAGEHAYLLDPFSLLLTRRAAPAVDADLAAALDQCRFRAVVLLGIAEDSHLWYETMQFGPGFIEELLARYRFAGTAGGHAIYLPTCGGATSVVRGLDQPGSETILARMARPSLLQQLYELLHGHRRRAAPSRPEGFPPNRNVPRTAANLKRAPRDEHGE